MARSGLLAFVVFFAWQMVAGSDRLPITAVETFHSPNGQVTAVVSSPPQGGYEQPSRVTLKGPGGAVSEYALFKGFPYTLHVLNDGRLVTVGRRGYGWPESAPDEHLQLITVVDVGGEVIFSADLIDLIELVGPIDFPYVVDGSPFWYRDATIGSADSDHLRVVLAGYHELHLALDTLALAYVPVPTEQFRDQPTKLRARAREYLAVRNPDGVSILEDLVDRFPGDPEAAYLLSRHVQREGDVDRSIAILRRLAANDPLAFSEDSMLRVGRGWQTRTNGRHNSVRSPVTTTWRMSPSRAVPTRHSKTPNATFVYIRKCRGKTTWIPGIRAGEDLPTTSFLLAKALARASASVARSTPRSICTRAWNAAWVETSSARPIGHVHDRQVVTSTPCQNATRPSIRRAAGLGDG